jgi:SAM-dependent methyltransferase
MTAVLAECSLSVMPAGERILSECWRVLAPGGRLAITDLYAREPRAMASLRSLPVACGAGMTTREELATRLEGQGFRVVLWEDHSPVLAEFAFRLIMAGGSPQRVWVRAGASQDEEGRIAEAVRKVRPGYFMLVARKKREARQGRSP